MAKSNICNLQLVAELERIRIALEVNAGQVVSICRWAEAARVDRKVLQQHLQFGWRCRDELLRSTRSLVLYIAKNYRGLGVAFEDLVQVGQCLLLLSLCLGHCHSFLFLCLKFKFSTHYKINLWLKMNLAWPKHRFFKLVLIS